MMVNPAKMFQERIRQRQAAEKAAEAARTAEKDTLQQMAADTEKYNLLKLQLENDIKAMRILPQGPSRNERKRDLLKTYQPLAEAYIAGEDIYKNEVLTETMIWLFDIGEIADATRFGKVAIEQNQPLPERFTRDVKTFYADAVLDWCKAQTDNPVEPYFSETMAEVMEWPVDVQIKVKYLKFAAVKRENDGYRQEALDLYNQAVKLYGDKAKCKTANANLKKQLDKK